MSVELLSNHHDQSTCYARMLERQISGMGEPSSKQLDSANWLRESPDRLQHILEDYEKERPHRQNRTMTTSDGRPSRESESSLP